MANKTEIGIKGENMAARFLERNGYADIERNYRYRRFEIDLIAREDDTLVFFEVKLRKNARFGYPEDFVDERKAEMILEAADQYLYDRDWRGPIRFDVISIIANKNELEIKHFKDAFY